MIPFVLFENDDFLIINKPAGLVVHSDGKTEEPSVVDWILEYFPDIQGVGENMFINHRGQTIELNRPGIVHRIDRDTSGLLMIAKTQSSFNYLKELFKNKQIEKKYIALVYGHIKNNEGIINQPIGRHTQDFRMKMAGHRARGELREAVTEYRVLGRYIDKHHKDKQGQYEKYSLVECSPQTGRTHQIRVHMKWLNSPIVADSLYQGKRKHHLSLTRMALHAHTLSFLNESGKQIVVHSELASDIEKVLNSLSLVETSL